MKAFLLAVIPHLKTIDTFESEYDFFNICGIVSTKAEAEAFLKRWKEKFEEDVEGISTIRDGKSVDIYVGEPIPKRTTLRDEYGQSFEVQTFENYPEEKAGYAEVNFTITSENPKVEVQPANKQGKYPLILSWGPDNNGVGVLVGKEDLAFLRHQINEIEMKELLGVKA
jgi:hypothetical protein